jgi:hypothetical protein
VSACSLGDCSLESVICEALAALEESSESGSATSHMTSAQVVLKAVRLDESALCYQFALDKRICCDPSQFALYPPGPHHVPGDQARLASERQGRHNRVESATDWYLAISGQRAFLLYCSPCGNPISDIGFLIAYALWSRILTCFRVNTCKKQCIGNKLSEFDGWQARIRTTDKDWASEARKGR